MNPVRGARRRRLFLGGKRMSAVRKVMILSIKAGAGHLRAAQAIEAAFRERYPDVEVQNIDALEYTNAAFRNSFTEGYETLAGSLPSVWGYLYETLDKRPADSRFKRVAALFDRLNAQPLKKKVLEFAPDRIVCTHYLPPEVFGPMRVKGTLAAPVFVALTDYDIHAMWLQRGVDCYFVATGEMKYALEARGVENTVVHETGIPIMPVFSRVYTRATVAKKLGIAPDVPTVLMSAGGFGLIKIDQLVEVLAAKFAKVQLLTVAGKNEKLKERLDRSREKFPDKIFPFGFVNNMHELMAASDFTIAKSGGLTTSESLAMGLPMVVINPIPGQEERNATFLLESGAGLWAHTVSNLIFKTEMLIENPQRLRAMQKAARRAARPDAAYRIADIVMAASS